MGAVFARRLWSLGLTTLGDVFRPRFGVGVERLAVVVMVPTSLLWAAAQIRAFGQVLSVASGWPPTAAMTLAAALAAYLLAPLALRVPGSVPFSAR